MAVRDIKVATVKKNFYLTLAVLATVLTVTYIYTRPLKVSAVMDGNLLMLENGRKIFLIGLDESRQARSFITGLVEGKRVRLDYERIRSDGNDRLYAYVYLSDGTFVNGEVIRKGYARVDTRVPFARSKELMNYQIEARAEKRGLWSDE